MNLEQYVGKYVDITYSDGDGASGWVKKIVEEKGVPHVVFDYGYGFPILVEENIKEVEPPPGDRGMFNG